MAKQLSDFNKKLTFAMGIDSDESKPFITVTKLAEYMEASAMRRREIVKIFRDDKDFIRNYYQSVRIAIPKFFKNNYNEAILDDAINVLTKEINLSTDMTNWETTDKLNSVLALKVFKNSELPQLDDYKIVTTLPKLTTIELGGVEISIKPDLYLENKHSKKVGALKIHIAKTETSQLSLECMQYGATIIKYGFITQGIDPKEVDNNGCILLDVFRKNFGVSPAAYKRRIGALTASCEEIALRWNSL